MLTDHELSRGVADAFLSASLAPAVASVAPTAVPVTADAITRRAGIYVQPNTLQIVELTAREGKLRVRDGPELIPVGENRFRSATNTVEFVFGAGEHAGYQRRLVSGGRPIAFEWKPPVVATRALLASYAGRYVSDELGGTVYTVTGQDSTIAVRTGTEPPNQGRLVYADVFLLDGSTMQFTRTKGAITGFEITDGRTRHVKFVKR